MKRTFWFGVIGALVVLPLPVDMMFDALFDRAFDSTFLIPASDAAIYHWITAIFPGGYTQAARAVLLSSWGGALLLSFLLKFLTVERLKFWKVSEEYKKRHKGGAKELVLKLALAAVFVFASLGSGMDWFFYYPPDTVTHMHTAFGGPTGPVMVFLFPAMQFASFGFLVAAMVYAVVTSVTTIEFLKKTAVGGLCMAAGIFALGSCAYLMDMEIALSDIPGVSGTQQGRVFVVLYKKPLSLPIYTAYRDCPASGGFCKKVEFGEENELAVEAYIEDRRIPSVLRGTGYSFIALGRLSRLDTLGAMKTYKRALDVTGDKSHGLSLMTRLLNAPASQEYRAMLDELTSGRYQLAGRNALRAGRLFSVYGELDSTRYWHNLGIRTAPALDEKNLSIFRVPDAPPFSGGSITGRVTLSGRPAAGVRVGLAVEHVIHNMLYTQEGIKEAVSPFYDMQNVMDGLSTDGDGRFRFGGLAENSYMLLLSLPVDGGGVSSAVAGPGVLTVSRSSPEADAGVIELKSSSQAPSP